VQKNSDYPIWAKVMSTEYQQLSKDTQRGVKTVMDSYGATNPAEFFAVATETFFEKPYQLLKKHPALYEQLQRYYQLNPVQWF
jgi:Mlc titration factor MtfA (ptsG expression regulator)